MWPIASKNMKNMDLQFADIIQFSEMACEKIIKNNFLTHYNKKIKSNF